SERHGRLLSMSHPCAYRLDPIERLKVTAAVCDPQVRYASIGAELARLQAFALRRQRVRGVGDGKPRISSALRPGASERPPPHRSQMLGFARKPINPHRKLISIAQPDAVIAIFGVVSL